MQLAHDRCEIIGFNRFYACVVETNRNAAVERGTHERQATQRGKILTCNMRAGSGKIGNIWVRLNIIWDNQMKSEERVREGYSNDNVLKINIYPVLHKYMFILLLFYYWLQVSASKVHHQANIYKRNLKYRCIQYKNVNFVGSHLHSLAVFTIITSLWK